MRNWKEYRFGELVHFPPRVVLRKGEEYPFIEMDVVNPNNRYVENTQRRKYESSSCSKFASGDVLLARITPCLENGKIAQVRTTNNESGFGSTEFFVFRVKDKLLDQSFLFYLAKSNLVWKSAVNSMVGASGRQRADATFLKKVKLLIPDPPVQRKIAAILSTYDELIENNQRRIALLEKMAEEIYREWFVRLRFPGHENVKFVKGVPEGWEAKKLGSVLELCYGKALKDDDRVPGEFHVYGSSGVVGTHNEALVKTPGLIVGRKGNVGSVYWPGRGFFPIDTVYFVKSELPNSFLYFLLRSMNFINNDAAVPGLNRSQAYSNLFFLPPATLINKYAEVADSLFEMKRFLTRQNENLTATRDSLLPRLISGKLSVENLDIQFPPSMEENAHEI